MFTNEAIEFRYKKAIASLNYGHDIPISSAKEYKLSLMQNKGVSVF